MLQRILITFLFLFTHCVFSQIDNPSDSLQRKSYKYLEGKIKNNTINQPLKSIYIDAYIEKAKKEKDTVEIGNGFYYKTCEDTFYTDGDFYATFVDENLYYKGLMYSDSIIYYTKNLNHRIFPGLGYSMKGFNFYNLGFEKDALDNYLIAYEYAQKHNNQVQLPEVKYAINVIRHNDKSNAEQTIKILDSLKNLINLKKKYLYDYLYELNNLVSDMQWEKKYDLASQYINEGIHKSIHIQEEFDFYHNFVFSAGVNYYFTKDYDKALDSINKAESKLDITSLSLAYHLKGKIFQETDTIKAIKYFNKVDSIFQINQTPIYGLLDNYKSLIGIHRQNNNYSGQMENIDKLIFADSIINVTKIYVEEKILNEYEIPKYKQEKEELILKLEEQKTGRKKNIVYLSILVLVVALICLYFLRKHLIYKKRYESLLSVIDLENNNTKNQIKENDGLNIAEETVQNIIEELKLFEKNKAFLNNDISLNVLSKNLNTNSSYLSKVINHHKGKSFANYINDLRVNYIVKQLKENKLLRKHTINAIAKDIGYNNTESFSKAFYKKTGLYPSYFIKQLNKGNN